MPTKTAETVHGSIEYQTIECDSCGNETVVDDAKDFQIGDREGKACEHCYQNGPISFPEKVKNKARDRITQGDGDMTFGVLAFPLTAFIFIIMANRQDWQRGYALASLGAILWFALAFGLWWLL